MTLWRVAGLITILLP